MIDWEYNFGVFKGFLWDSFLNTEVIDKENEA